MLKGVGTVHARRLALGALIGLVAAWLSARASDAIASQRSEVLPTEATPALHAHRRDRLLNSWIIQILVILAALEGFFVLAVGAHDSLNASEAGQRAIGAALFVAGFSLLVGSLAALFGRRTSSPDSDADEMRTAPRSAVTSMFLAGACAGFYSRPCRWFRHGTISRCGSLAGC
jgi:hypothetical protein